MDEYPQYYSSLGPFQKLFQQGLPILTYHKLGKRPSHVRLKGLYLSERLFRKQLSELNEVGRRNVMLNAVVDHTAWDVPSYVVTFDDGYENVFRCGLPILAEQKVTAIQYLVASHLGGTNFWDVICGEAPERLMDALQVREWLAAGQMIGAHTCDHVHLSQLSEVEIREQIVGAKKKLEDLFGVPIYHFCYPYGDYTPRIAEIVRDAGYKTACTVSPGVNIQTTSHYELLRLTARYQSRNLKLWFRRFCARFRKHN